MKIMTTPEKIKINKKDSNDVNNSRKSGIKNI
jgi:hypothetical protein